jgi:hypothetical protein
MLSNPELSGDEFCDFANLLSVNLNFLIYDTGIMAL